MACLAAGGALWGAERARWAGDLPRHAGEYVRVGGAVIGEQAGSRPRTALVAVERLGGAEGWRRGRGRLVVTGRAVGRWSYGDRVELSGRLRSPAGEWERGVLRRRGGAFLLET